jgi:hypothetical protein
MDSNPPLQPSDARHGQQQQGRSRLNPVAHRVRVTQEARAGFPFLGSECCAGAEPQAGVGGKGQNRVFGSWRVVFAIWGVCVFGCVFVRVSRGVEAWIACGNQGANGPDRVLGFWILDALAVLQRQDLTREVFGLELWSFGVTMRCSAGKLLFTVQCTLQYIARWTLFLPGPIRILCIKSRQ